MPDLESEEYAAQRRNQQRKELKILTPNQMLSRLPIFLVQLKAGNYSEKLKNEIKQLTVICISWVPGDPRTIFLVISFTRKMPESSDSMCSSIFMLENI